MRANQLPINGSVIQEKASELAEEFGIEDFRASSGWLTNWKNRNNVSFRKICGEEEFVSEEAIEEWVTKELPEILNRYDLRDILDADEFGLFLRPFQIKQWLLFILR